ncbi:MAG: hypothetical protein V1792_14425 [Pseudomonadota bacterium]
MRKLMTIVLGAAVVAGMCMATAGVSSAKTAADTGAPAQQVKCCIKGECKTMSAKACTGGGGKPVGDCKQCKKTQ